MAFVADNSVVVAWFVGTQANSYTRRLARKARRDAVNVPAIWSCEFVNVLCVHERRGILAPHEVARFIHQAERLVNVDVAAVSMAALHRLASEHDLSAYDAAYLELAIRLGQPLGARDGKLRRTALALGILAN